ncbi:MAG: FtsX-like permease family protein [Candidatus Lokiarchaeota archaeon]|nr:FtsX-like permease family protein [Candidatus Lokiarchaeota archaeon]
MNIIAYAFKDLKTQKFRAILGVVGVAVSIFLLTSVSFLTDAVSSAYVDYLVTDAGGMDATVSYRWLDGYTDSTFGSEYNFSYNELIEKIEVETDQIEHYIPRYRQWHYFYTSRWGWRGTEMVGLNISYEEEIGFGKFLNTGYDFVTHGIPEGYCAISSKMAEEWEIFVGDSFRLYWWEWVPEQYWLSHYYDLTILSVFDHLLKFPTWMEEIVVVDLSSIPTYFNNSYGGMEGRVNHLHMTFKNSQSLYDVRDIQGSERAVESIGAKIQTALGYGYWVDLPKLTSLGDAEYLSIGTRIIFIFISLISMLISGILINGILSTSVEEKIREFGIFRTLGARKNFNLKLVIVQGLLICVTGTTIGIFLSWLGVSQILLPLSTRWIPSEILSSPIQFVLRPTTLLISYAIGIGVSLVVSLSPAIKVMRLQIVEAINPYRHEESVYKLVKEETVNVRLIIIGLILAINGGLIFFFLPRLIVTLNFSLLSTILIIVLLAFLVGLTMAGIGLMPLLLRFWIAILRPFARKLIAIIRVTIFRHERRNSSTILMFCLSFSFVLFASSMVEIQNVQVGALIQTELGSPLVIRRAGHSRAITTDFQEELMQIEGIERSSVVLAHPELLKSIYAYGEDVYYDAEIGDYINLKSSDIRLYALDKYYVDTIYTEYIQMSRGTIKTSFPALFNGNNTCIISTALSEDLSLNLYDTVRLTFIRGDETTQAEFEIVGIASLLPGLDRFKGSSIFGGADGVAISHEKYLEYMEIPKPAWAWRIFVSVREDMISQTQMIEEKIDETLYGKWTFGTYNVQNLVQEVERGFLTVQIVLQIILSFTIVICMFGLFASSYSSILERKREIGILRALGLRREGVSRLFTVESVVILLASGSTGTIVGFSTAALLSQNLSIFAQSPRLLSFPTLTTLILFAVSLVVLLVGMMAILRKIKRKNLMEIFRETQ